MGNELDVLKSNKGDIDRFAKFLLDNSELTDEICEDIGIPKPEVFIDFGYVVEQCYYIVAISMIRFQNGIMAKYEPRLPALWVFSCSFNSPEIF